MKSSDQSTGKSNKTSSSSSNKKKSASGVRTTASGQGNTSWGGSSSSGGSSGSSGFIGPVIPGATGHSGGHSSDWRRVGGGDSGSSGSSGYTPSLTPITPYTGIKDTGLVSEMDLDLINQYRNSLLDINALPNGFTRGDGSRSTDVTATRFENLGSGGVNRYDSTLSNPEGNVTFIPNAGTWRKTGDGSTDPEMGSSYAKNDSPYSLSLRFRRGENLNVDPNYYDAGREQQTASAMWNKTLTPQLPENTYAYQRAKSMGKLDEYYSSDTIQNDSMIQAAGLDPGGLTPEEKAVMVEKLKEMGY
ncbi:MAG: hypothetical protein M0R80_13530 [Proteobacteria bacterium]|jgi:hypothetical protein|nr:hypothetical protein [Pseudomonadota bacterium]